MNLEFSCNHGNDLVNTKELKVTKEKWFARKSGGKLVQVSRLTGVTWDMLNSPRD